MEKIMTFVMHINFEKTDQFITNNQKGNMKIWRKFEKNPETGYILEKEIVLSNQLWKNITGSFEIRSKNC